MGDRGRWKPDEADVRAEGATEASERAALGRPVPAPGKVGPRGHGPLTRLWRDPRSFSASPASCITYTRHHAAREAGPYIYKQLKLKLARGELYQAA